MSILERLGFRRSSQPDPAADTRTVRRIVSELEAMEAERARYVASFAYILSRVAYADREISDDEVRAMETLVQRVGHLPEAQAVLVVQMARNQTLLFGGTEDYLVTREFKEISTPEQRRELLDCLFAVSAADENIDSAEEAQIRQIANELLLSHRDFVEARAAYSDKREVMKLLRDTTGPE